MSADIYSISAPSCATFSDTDPIKIAPLTEAKRKLLLGPLPTTADYETYAEASRYKDVPRRFGFGWGGRNKIYVSKLFSPTPRRSCGTCELANLCRNQSININFIGCMIERSEGFPHHGTPTEQWLFVRDMARRKWGNKRMFRLIWIAEIALWNRAKWYEKDRTELREQWRRERSERYRKAHPGVPERVKRRAKKRAEIDASLAGRKFKSVNPKSERQRRWREGKKLAAAAKA